MSSAGHVLDMIKRSRYNDSIRRKRVERMRDIKDAYQEEIRKHHHINFERKQINPQHLEEVKKRIRKRIVAKKRRVWLFTSLLTLASIIIIYYFILLPFIQVNAA